MRYFASAVTVVTGTLDTGELFGLTVSAFSSVSLEPPLVLICIRNESSATNLLTKSRRYCVNILAEDQEALSRDFAVSGGDKFTGVGWRPAANGAPLLDGALAWVECELELAHEAGDHELVLGAVQGMGVRRGRPLIYYRGGFGRFEP